MTTAVSPEKALRFDLSNQLPAVEGDPAQLTQVVVNLIRSPVESASGRPMDIAVHTSVTEASAKRLTESLVDGGLAPAQFVFFEVADEGDEMSPKVLPRVFDLFYTRKEHGRGLGLSSVVRIVRSHHGVLGVQSEGGVGSVFRVLLPAARDQSTGTAAILSHPTHADRRFFESVLVADDDELARNTTASMVKRLGYQVIVARDGRQALHWRTNLQRGSLSC